mgnify:CR=1 FL=1
MIRGIVLAVAMMTFGAADVLAEDSPNAVIESSVALFAEQLAGRREELAANRDELYKIVDAILLPLSLIHI